MVNGPPPYGVTLRPGPRMRSNVFLTTVAVTGVPSAQVASLRSVKLTLEGVTVHDVARYGRIVLLPGFFGSGPVVMSRSYSGNTTVLHGMLHAPPGPGAGDGSMRGQSPVRRMVMVPSGCDCGAAGACAAGGAAGTHPTAISRI